SKRDWSSDVCSSDLGDALQVYQEVDLEVAFAIMVKKGLSLDDVHTIATHPVAYQQVRGWLTENIPDAKFQPASSNGAAAEAVSRDRKSVVEGKGGGG